MIIIMMEEKVVKSSACPESIIDALSSVAQKWQTQNTKPLLESAKATLRILSYTLKTLGPKCGFSAASMLERCLQAAPLMETVVNNGVHSLPGNLLPIFIIQVVYKVGANGTAPKLVKDD